MSLLMRANETPRKSSLLDDDACWKAVKRRDRAVDGTFFYSVRTTGVYCRPSCAARLPRREELAGSNTVTEAIYGAGFNSNGRFYAAASDLLGMTPTQFRAGGSGHIIRFAVGQCSLGAILVAATDKGVCAIEFGDDPEALVRGLQDRFPNARLVGGDERFERLVAKVVGFIEAPGKGLDLPLDIRGTAFQQRVWTAIRDIPAGSTASYREIAERIGAPKAVRAVAQACASNDIAVAIPCHRVVRMDGSTSGYRWGVARKRALLAREKAALRGPFPPRASAPRQRARARSP